MHIIDGMETFRAYGIGLEGQAGRLQDDPYLSQDVQAMTDVWVAVSVALNSMNRGMGQPDLYPFVLSARVIDKLAFVHQLIQNAAARLPVL